MGWLEDAWDQAVANSKKRKAARKKERAQKAAERAVTGQNRFDQWLTGLVGGGVERRQRRRDSGNESTFYVDPREYDVVQDPVTGQYMVGNTVVFKGSPLHFDLASELRAYRSKYGVPSNWKTLGSHWNQVKVPVIGAAKDVRQSTAVKQKWIQSSSANPNTMTKLYADNKANLDFNRKMLNYAQTGSDVGAIARKTVNVASKSPAGILLKIFKYQADLILAVFKASIDEAIKENNLIKSSLASRGIDVDKRLQELKQVRANEDWELYKYDDLQRPSSQILSRTPSLLAFGPVTGVTGLGLRPPTGTGSKPITGGNAVPFKPSKPSKDDTIFTPTNIALVGVGAILIYTFTRRKS